MGKIHEGEGKESTVPDAVVNDKRKVRYDHCIYVFCLNVIYRICYIIVMVPHRNIY